MHYQISNQNSSVRFPLNPCLDLHMQVGKKKNELCIEFVNPLTVLDMNGK